MSDTDATHSAEGLRDRGHPAAPPAPPPIATTSLEGILAAAGREASGGAEPPVGWLTRTAAAIRNCYDLDPTHQTHPAPAPQEHAVEELTRLRRLVREQLAAAVREDALDVDLANAMLEMFGLPELPRRWSVRLSLPLTCEVTASSEEEAFDAAENAICEALIASGVPIDPDWTDCEQQHATPGEVDHNAL